MSRENCSSRSFYQEWEGRSTTPMRSSNKSTSHTPKVGKIVREFSQPIMPLINQIYVHNFLLYCCTNANKNQSVEQACKVFPGLLYQI